VIGDLKGQSAKQTLDADGQIVAPGFIDGHTHMDAQIFWDPLGNNSVWHGVTSVIMGNCGFSLAPCAEKDKEIVFNNLERAEDISPAAMNAGIPWSWETFPEYLDVVDKLPKGINYSGYVGHSALRTYVMGERAMSEPANADDLVGLKRNLEESIRAGAMGMSTTCASTHRTPDGRPVASRLAEWSEVEELVGVMSTLGAGVFEIARENNEHSLEEAEAERDQLKKLAIDSKVPVTFGNPWYKRWRKNTWRTHLLMADEITAAGGKVLIQGSATWHNSLRSFETIMPYDKAAVWSEFRALPIEEQKKGLKDPAMRQRLIDAAKNHIHKPNPAYANAFNSAVDWDWFFPMTDALPPFKSMAAHAAETGKDPVELLVDMSIDSDFKLFFVDPANNEDLDVCIAMINHPRTAVTFTDSGAHVTVTVNPVHTFLLGHWVRNAQAITIEAAIRKITFDVAAFWGIQKRGLLKEGWHADLCIFDLNTVKPQLPSLVHDLPTGAPRLLQKADGIMATIVNGEILIKDNQHTGALPGRLIRGPLAHH
jgi:N-acyl-D-amino-acid deacylase